MFIFWVFLYIFLFFTTYWKKKLVKKGKKSAKKGKKSTKKGKKSRNLGKNQRILEKIFF